MKKIELLLPAGDLEKLKIAVMYGADAVFVGSKEFSLRSRASNFTIDDLDEAVKFAHKYHSKVYVTTNIVPHNADLDGLIDYLKELERIKVDAIICSSFAIMDLAKKHTKLDIHISTQQSVINSEAVKFFKEFGATRVVLGRELCLEQIKKIKDNVDIELEVFIHGGMCSSLSGRCMLSNHMTNRDANRGGCAHSCRWNYDLYQDDEKISDQTKFQFASKDLMAVRELPELIKISDSLKIEGRMKSIHYIATVCKVYREEIDEYYENGYIKDFKKYEDEIKKAENREFSSGFLNKDLNPIDRQLYNFDSQRPTQDFVGIVKGYDKEKKMAIVEVRNHFTNASKIEIFGPKKASIIVEINQLFNEDMEEIMVANHPKDIVYFKCEKEVFPYDMVRLLR